MGKLIYTDNVNNIYVSETSDGSIEVSLEADGSIVCVKVETLSALEELAEKMIILHSVFFNTIQTKGE